MPIPLIHFCLKPLLSGFRPCFYTDTTLTKVNDLPNMSKFNNQFSFHILLELSPTSVTVECLSSLKNCLHLTSRIPLAPRSASTSQTSLFQPPVCSFLVSLNCKRRSSPGSLLIPSSLFTRIP